MRNAATRSGEASFRQRSGGGRRQSSPSSPRQLLSGELERAGIDLAARPAGKLDRMRHRILDAVALQARSQQIVQLVRGHRLRIRRWRADHQHEFAARLQRVGALRQLVQRARA